MEILVLLLFVPATLLSIGLLALGILWDMHGKYKRAEKKRHEEMRKQQKRNQKARKLKRKRAKEKELY